MNLRLTLPVLIPFSAAIAALLFWRWRAAQRAIGMAGAAGLFGSALWLLASVWREGILTTQIGNWPAPFGITFVADLFSAIMVSLAGLTGLAVAVYSLMSVDARREAFGYYPLYNILLMGVCGAFLTGDIFNLYVWFEVMLIASFVLLALGGERAQLEGSLKYVTLNLLSSAIFLAAVGLLYGVAGTLNMADLSLRMNAVAPPWFVAALATLFLVAFGVKAAVFPLFFWLPASYHTPPVAVSAVFAGLLTKVGVYALIRVFTLLFVQNVGFTHTLILVISGLTMVTGVLGAAAQYEFRRILSFHIISQIGYMILGLGLFTPLALAGSVFYLIHHIIVKTNLFLVSGVVYKLQGSYQLNRLGGLFEPYPALGALFLISALSLAGLPPLSGFWAKLALARAGFESAHYAIVAVALVVSLLTLYSMMKIWAAVFWSRPPANGAAQQRLSPRSRLALYAPMIALAALTIAIGLLAEPFFKLATRAAEQLLHREEYIRAVLGADVQVVIDDSTK